MNAYGHMVHDDMRDPFSSFGSEVGFPAGINIGSKVPFTPNELKGPSENYEPATLCATLESRCGRGEEREGMDREEERR